MKTFFSAVIAFALGALVAFQFLHRPAAPGDGDKEKEPEPGAETGRVHRDTNGTVFVVLDPETRGRMGLQTAPVTTETRPAEWVAHGRVLDPSPLAALVLERASAEAALAASSREHARLQLLFAQNQITPAHLLEAAEAAARRDELLVEGARLRLSAAWGPALAARTNLAALLARLAAQQAAIVRLDLPPGEIPAAPPAGVRIAAATGDAAPAPATLLGPAPVTDPQLQGRGFLVLAEQDPPPPGTAMTGWLTPAAEPAAAAAEPVIVVPRAALLRHAGGTFVELQVTPDRFERREVELDRPTDAGWRLRRGLRAGDVVVVAGAQQLLSEELKGAGGAD